MPIEEIGKIISAKNPGTYFHVDAVQGFTKALIYPAKMHIDLMSVSGHKIHGPKGSGFLYVNERVKIDPIIFGGGQQNELRSGTENVPGIVGLAKAASILYNHLDEDVTKLYSLKQRLVDGLLSMEGVTVNGLTESGNIKETAPHIVSASFEGVRSEVLLHTLESEGIYVSSKSACSSHKRVPSYVLVAVGVKKELLESTLRFSFCVNNTEEEVDAVLDALKKHLPILRKYSRH